MPDIAASVLTRLKNKAKESGRSYQLCLQLFCQEEFLRRLEKSKYAENLVLKGGLFLYSLTDFDSRVTVDVDFLLQRIPNTPEKLKGILEEIITVQTGNDFVTFEIKDITPIAVTKKYAGIGASMVAYIKNTRTPFGIDFGVGDIIVPKQEKRKIPTQLDDFIAPTINTYSIETTVAEKIDAILSLMEFSSRMKDYYDIYYLANKFDFDGTTTINTYSIETTVAEKIDAILSLMEFSSRMKDYYDIYYLANKFDFDGTTLSEALKKTFTNRAHSFTAAQFEQVMNFDDDAAMQKKWKTFIRKIDTKTDNYSTILKTIQAFLTKPFTAAIEDRVFTGSWIAQNNEWI